MERGTMMESTGVLRRRGWRYAHFGVGYPCDWYAARFWSCGLENRKLISTRG